jgi:hypothetical protein
VRPGCEYGFEESIDAILSYAREDVVRLRQAHPDLLFSNH